METECITLSEFLHGESLRGLVQVDQRSAPILGNAAESALQRGVAFASSRSEDVAHQAMRVHSNQHRIFAVLNVSTNQRHVRLTTIDFARIGDHAKLAKARVDQR